MTFPTPLLPLMGCLVAASIASANYKPVPLEQGAAAPDFKLTGVDDQAKTLADIQGEKATVVIFTTNHCPDAISSFDRMTALVEHFKPQGVGFVAINSNSPDGLYPQELGWTAYTDSFDDMKLVAKDWKFNLPYLYDGETQEVAKAYGAVATPHVFIFDKNLQLKYNGRMDSGRRTLGPAEKNEAHDALTAILAGKEPAVAKTRPVGCTTKWKEKSGKVADELAKWNAHPVTVETINAEEVARLAKNEGGREFRLFNLWATSCGPCVLEFPDLTAIFRQYSWRDFEFIPISLDPVSELAAVTEFLEDQECGLPTRTAKNVIKDGRTTNNYLFDGDTEDLVKALDPEWNGAMPHTLLVDENGKVIYRHTGVIDPLALRKIIVAKVWSKNAE